MRKGRASCKRCGTEVRAEIGVPITCQGCGRKFEIPHEPQYFLTPLFEEVQKVPFMALQNFITLQNEAKKGGQPESEFQFDVRPLKIGRVCKPKFPIPIAHWRATIRQFQKFSNARIEEMIGFSREGIPGANRYIKKLEERLSRLSLLPF